MYINTSKKKNYRDLSTEPYSFLSQISHQNGSSKIIYWKRILVSMISQYPFLIDDKLFDIFL